MCLSGSLKNSLRDTEGLISVSSEEAFCLSSHLQTRRPAFDPACVEGVFPKNVTGGSLCFPGDSVRSF